MIEAKHTYLGTQVKKLYSGYRLNKAFCDIRYVGEFTDQGKPVLMIGNHFSWWDGFIQCRLNDTLIHRKLYVMMLEEQLKNFRILSEMGAYSVRKNSRDILESLRYTVDLLTDNKNIVLIFPQGKIQSMHVTEYHFENGLAYILKHLKKEIQFVFNVNLVDYFSEKKPSLTIYQQEADYKNKSLQSIEDEYNRFASWCRQQQMKP